MAVENQGPLTEDILEEEVESLPGGEEVDVSVEGEEVEDQRPYRRFSKTSWPLRRG